MQNISDRVFELVKDNFSLHPSEIHAGAEIFDGLGFDSLDALEFVMALETEFDIEIPDEDAEKFETLGDVISYIQDVKSN